MNNISNKNNKIFNVINNKLMNNKNSEQNHKPLIIRNTEKIDKTQIKTININDK